MTTSAGAEEYTIIENDGLAFDHAKIIVCALERLRAQTVSGGAAFHLLPERFTLTELQQVHEVLLGRPLLKAAFRRKIAPLVQETDQMTQNAGHQALAPVPAKTGGQNMICYDLKTLQKAYCSGENCRFLFFWGHTPRPTGM